MSCFIAQILDDVGQRQFGEFEARFVFECLADFGGRSFLVLQIDRGIFLPLLPHGRHLFPHLRIGIDDRLIVREGDERQFSLIQRVDVSLLPCHARSWRCPACGEPCSKLLPPRRRSAGSAPSSAPRRPPSPRPTDNGPRTSTNRNGPSIDAAFPAALDRLHDSQAFVGLWLASARIRCRVGLFPPSAAPIHAVPSPIDLATGHALRPTTPAICGTRSSVSLSVS